MIEIAKTRDESRFDSSSKVCSEIDKVGVIVIATVTGVIGVWAVACLFSGMVAAGGPIALLKGFVIAITGV